jgi:hypothetical protein
MSRGTWEDFSDKYGFNDGNSVDTLDYAARDFLLKKLNGNQIMRGRKLRAVTVICATVHNGCQIFIVRDEGALSGISKVEDELPPDTKFEKLPKELKNMIEDLVYESYDSAWAAIIRRKPSSNSKGKRMRR